MSPILFTEKKHLTSNEVREKMHFGSLLLLLDELKKQENTIFETAPMESFEQVTAKYASVTDNGHFIDEVQFLNHSVN